MLGSEIEKKAISIAVKNGWMTLKVTGKKGWPDRAFFKNGEVIFIEFKSLTEKVSPTQIKIIRDLRNENFKAFICRSVENALEILGIEQC